MIKGVTRAIFGPIWYYSDPSDALYSPNQFLCWDFFSASYNKTALVYQIEVQEQDQINVQIQGKSGNFSSKLINVPASLFGTLEQVHLSTFFQSTPFSYKKKSV